MSIANQIVTTLLEADPVDPKSMAMRIPPLRLSYVISGHMDGAEQLFWSNRYGWTALMAATRFKADEIKPSRLPIGWTGVWELINGRKLGDRVRAPVQEADEIDPKAFVTNKNLYPIPKIKTTFSTVTWREDGAGDPDAYDEEHGYEDEDGEEFETDEFDREDGIDVADKVVQWLRSKGVSEASSSHFHPGIWYSSEPETDMRTGASTTRSFHLEGFTPQEEQEIFSFLMARRNQRGHL
jgi:hypothetical protein